MDSVNLRTIRNKPKQMNRSHLILIGLAFAGLLVGVAVKGYVDAHTPAAPAA